MSYDFYLTLKNLEKIKGTLGIRSSAKDRQIEALIPFVVSYVSKRTNIPFDTEPLEIMDETLQFVCAKLIEIFMKEAGIKNETHSRSSVTYESEIPPYLNQILDSYTGSAISSGVKFF